MPNSRAKPNEPSIQPTNRPKRQKKIPVLPLSGVSSVWPTSLLLFSFLFVYFVFFCSFDVIVMSPVVSRELRTCFFLLPTFVPFLALNEKQESHNKVNGNNKRPENSKLYVISLNLRLPLCWGSLSLCVSLFYLFVTCLFGLCRKIENLKQGFFGR